MFLIFYYYEWTLWTPEIFAFLKIIFIICIFLNKWFSWGVFWKVANREPVRSCVCVCVCVYALSHVWLFAAPWIVVHQAPLPMEFSRQEYWRGLPFPSPGDLPNPGIKCAYLVSSALAGRFFTSSSTTWEAPQWS